MTAIRTALALLAIVFVMAAPAGAQETAKQRTTVTEVTATPLRTADGTERAGWYELQATLRTAAGVPVRDRALTFYEHVDFFGARESRLGKAQTDVRGTATIHLESSRPGTRAVSARFEGDAVYAPGETRSDIALATAVAEHAAEPTYLGPLLRWLPAAVLVITLGVWFTVIGAFLRALRGIRAASTAVADPTNTASEPSRASTSDPNTTRKGETT